MVWKKEYPKEVCIAVGEQAIPFNNVARESGLCTKVVTLGNLDMLSSLYLIRGKC